MDNRQLNAFVALADELHFGKAAQRLNITQPALSQHIKALEQSLNLQLFARDKRNVALTDAGLLLIDEARLALQHFANVRQQANSLSQGYRGLLRLGYVGSSILDPSLTQLIARYRQHNPAIEIIIEEHSVDRQLALLLDHQLDVALVRSPVPHYPPLDYLDIACRVLVAVLPQTHPLAAKGQIALNELRDSPFLIQRDPPGVGLGWSVLDACQQAGFVPHTLQYTRDVSVAMGLVAMGVGVTLVPETQCSVRVPGVCYCRLSAPRTATTLTLSWSRAARNKVVRDFIQFAVGQTEPLPGVPTPQPPAA